MRMHVPLAKPQPWVVPVTIVCLALGALVATLTSVTPDTDKVDTSQMNREQLAILYAKATQENEAQQKDLDELRTRINQLTDSAVSEQKMKDTLQQQIDELRVYAGTTPVKGPGILIVLDDTGNLKNSPVDPNTNLRIVHDSDLLTLVNELRSAGAEAIDINGFRVIASTAIRCAGPVIQVNNSQVAPPFRIRAIGKPDTLYGAVNMPNGVFDWLRQLDIRVEVTKKDSLSIPAVKLLPRVEYSTPVLEETPEMDKE